MKVRRKKSYYSKVFFGLLLVLLVAVVAIGSIFWQAKTTVEEQILIMNRATLVQSLNHVDEVIKSAADTAKSVAFSTQYNALSRRFISEPQKHAYLAWALEQQLSAYANEKFFDVFVYYPGNGYVISAKNSFATLENYYRYHYRHIGDIWQELQQVANSPSKQPVLCSFNGKGEGSYQCVTLRAGHRVNESMEYVVVVVLNQQYMNQVFREMVAYSEGSGVFFVMDEAKNVVFCTETTLAEQAVDIYQQTDQVYRRTIGETDYMLHSQVSSQMNVYYAYAISSDYFWSELYDIYVIFLLGIFLLTLLGGWSVFWQSRRIYRPFEETIRKLQKKTNRQWDVDLHTELEFIESVFSSAQEEKLRLTTAVKQDKQYKRNRFITSVLEGETPVSGESEDVFAENGITLCSNRFRVILLKLETSQEQPRSLLAFAIGNVLEELFSGTHRGYVVVLAPDRYALLVNLDSRAEPSGVDALLEEGLAFLKKHFGMTFTVGSGEEKQGMSAIRDAYSEAVTAMKYRYLLGLGTRISYSQVRNRVFKWPQKERMSFAFNDFMTGQRGDPEAALAYVDECLRHYHIDSDATLDMVECFVFEVVNNFNRYISRMGQEDTSWKEHIMILPQSQTLWEFREHFAQLLVRVYGKLRENEKENDICARARNHIQQHYQEENLSLAELSRIFGLTPSYFSRLFKEKYQVSIPDYINTVRIDRAKKLLEGTGQSIQWVACAVGFPESSTFIRTFKKMEGITPGVYRTLTKQ